MKILFALDEAYPLYKVGGLGDVGGSLPIALNEMGTDVRIALPAHPEIEIDSQYSLEDSFGVVYDKERLGVRVYKGYLPGTQIPVYLFQEHKYISDHTDASDNHADKFALFSLCISTWLARDTAWKPHLIHLHDWHVALMPLILKHLFPHLSYKTIITIHNLAYQGITTTPIIQKLDLDTEKCKILSWDLGNVQVNILLQGLLHSDMITTVSPTYANEILTPEYGAGLHQVLESRKGNLVGIINGIDTQVWNPQTDQFIAQQYSLTNALESKQKNKINLQKELNLDEGEKTLIGFVGRVDSGQKGIELIIQALKNGVLTDQNTQFIFLGTGDPSLEKGLHESGDHLSNCKIITRYDENLAHKIYASCDLTLIPSRYEPCGLVQMISMGYGALPIARRTGGLADTIFSDKGFLFNDYEAEAFIDQIQIAKKVIENRDIREKMIQAGMGTDFSWHLPANKYLNLYQKILLE